MTQPDLTPAADAGSGKRDLLHDRRALGLIGVAVVAVGAAGYFVVLPMLSGSSSSSASGSVPHGSARQGAHAAATATPGGSAAATIAPQLQVRDPFSPLYVAPTAAAGGGTPSAAASTPAAVGVASQPQTIVIVEPGGTANTGGGTVSKPSYTLTVTQINGLANVHVTLNGTPLTVVPQQMFPSSANGPFQLDSIGYNGPNQPVAVFSYGDQQFELAVGQTQTES